MNSLQIEAWALRIIDRIDAGQPIEDFRVELKSVWLEPQKAARRIAGHANFARGEQILWLIGIDEKKGVVGAKHEEFADWYSAVKAHFDGPSPAVKDKNVFVNGTTIVALLFETNNIPYVVKNPAYGSKEGGPVSREVPWRENTSTRTATRSDLLRLLSPIQKLPSIEVIAIDFSVHLQVNLQNVEHLSWDVGIELYVVPRTEERVVIPFHKCYVSFEILDCIEPTSFNQVSLSPAQPSNVVSATIEASATEVLIKGPGSIRLSAHTETPVLVRDFEKRSANITADLLPTGTEFPISIREVLDDPESNRSNNYHSIVTAKWKKGQQRREPNLQIYL